MNTLHSLPKSFYVQPMAAVYLETVWMYLLWALGMLLLRGKARRIAAIAGTVLAVLLIVMFTVYGRHSSDNKEVILTPFITFVWAKKQPEYYRTMYMNFLLFMPLGLSLPFALPGKLHCRVLLTIGCGFLLSVAVETAQWFFATGRCETDDVLMNTLGACVGATACLLHAAVCILIKRIREQ